MDIEGAELAILESIPWNKVDIKILSIEVGEDRRNRDSVNELMAKAGYTKVVELLGELDNIYVRNDVRSPRFGADQVPKQLHNMTRKLYLCDGICNFQSPLYTALQY